MSERLATAYIPDLSESLARKAEEWPTLGKILRGEVSMRPLPTSSSIDSQGGHLGRWDLYEVTIPGAGPDSSDWETYLSHWKPLPLSPDLYQQPARPRVTILTGEGQLPLSHDPEIIDAVVNEMYRQKDLHEEPENLDY